MPPYIEMAFEATASDLQAQSTLFLSTFVFTLVLLVFGTLDTPENNCCVVDLQLHCKNRGIFWDKLNFSATAQLERQ